MGFLHGIKDYIFGLSIPVATFWYNEYIGAITVPWLKKAPNSLKSALSALFASAWKRVLCRPYSEVDFLHRIKDYILGSPFP